jgi:hypothetical protein
LESLNKSFNTDQSRSGALYEARHRFIGHRASDQNIRTEAVQVTNTHDRPHLSSEGAPNIDKTANVKQKLMSGHETQTGLETKTD